MVLKLALGAVLLEIAASAPADQSDVEQTHLSQLAVSCITVVVLVSLFALCASKEDRDPARNLSGAEPSTAGQVVMRAPMGAPARLPYETQIPAVPASQVEDQIFVREIVNGQVGYRQITVQEADERIAKGEQVFRTANRQEAGQDIYEAVTTSNDLYASVSKPAGAGAMDLYATPAKPTKPTGQTQPAEVTVPETYATPKKPQQAKKGYINQEVFDRVNGEAEADTYEPIDIQAQSSNNQALLYEPIETDAPAPAPPSDLEKWMTTTLSRNQAGFLLERTPIGTYIVRQSTGGGYAISVRGERTVLNFKIIGEGGFYHVQDNSNPNPKSFGTIDDLLIFYRDHDVKARGALPVHLKEVLSFSKYHN